MRPLTLALPTPTLMPEARPPVPSCPNQVCENFEAPGPGRVVRHGKLQRRFGPVQRFRCKSCEKTWVETHGGEDYRIHYPTEMRRRVIELFDQGVSIAEIARREKIAWNTAQRWIERARQKRRQDRKRPDRRGPGFDEFENGAF